MYENIDEIMKWRWKKEILISANAALLHQFARVNLFGISISDALLAAICNVCLPVQCVYSLQQVLRGLYAYTHATQICLIRDSTYLYWNDQW